MPFEHFAAYGIAFFPFLLAATEQKQISISTVNTYTIDMINVKHLQDVRQKELPEVREDCVHRVDLQINHPHVEMPANKKQYNSVLICIRHIYWKSYKEAQSIISIDKILLIRMPHMK